MPAPSFSLLQDHIHWRSQIIKHSLLSPHVAAIKLLDHSSTLLHILYYPDLKSGFNGARQGDNGQLIDFSQGLGQPGALYDKSMEYWIEDT